MEEVTKKIDESGATDGLARPFVRFRMAGCSGTWDDIGSRENWLTIKNWLYGRKQRMVVEGYFSNRRPVTHCIPWGLVLNPLLFVTYINSLDENVVGMINSFADDNELCKLFFFIHILSVFTLIRPLVLCYFWCASCFFYSEGKYKYLFYQPFFFLHYHFSCLNLWGPMFTFPLSFLLLCFLLFWHSCTPLILIWCCS